MSFILYIKEVKEMKVAIVGAGKLGIKVAFYPFWAAIMTLP